LSARAAWRLEALGFASVLRYVGGRREWFAFGHAMEGARAAQPRGGDVARRDVPTCRLSDRLGEVRTRVRASGWDTCIVVSEGGVVLGRLGPAAWRAPGPTVVEQVMDTPTTYRPDNRLDALVGVMRAKRAKSLLITDPDGVLVGQLRREDAERQATGRKRGRGVPSTPARGRRTGRKRGARRPPR
jgi:CBS domain-containing protein